jgi:hypothetical protein
VLEDGFDVGPDGLTVIPADLDQVVDVAQRMRGSLAREDLWIGVAGGGGP